MITYNPKIVPFDYFCFVDLSEKFDKFNIFLYLCSKFINMILICIKNRSINQNMI